MDAAAVNMARNCAAGAGLPTLNCHSADVHDTGGFKYALSRLGLVDDRAARTGTVDRDVLDVEVSHTEVVGAGWHSNSIGAATRGAGVDGSIRVGRLNRLPQGAIAINVKFINGGSDCDVRCVNCAGPGQHQREHQSQGD